MPGNQIMLANQLKGRQQLKVVVLTLSLPKGKNPRILLLSLLLQLRSP
jgi:hypothetical protein